jgi:hypothetical protein
LSANYGELASQKPNWEAHGKQSQSVANTIFFSWQVDTETRGGRNLIDTALQRAAARIGQDAEIEEAIRDVSVDRDTKGVAGSPPIVDTIFRKIDSAAVFVPDLTFIGKRPDGRPTPNPNVLIEYGWALKSLKYGRIVPVMNTAFGAPTADAMPFDMRHLRNPITYECAPDLGDSDRGRARDQLAKKLESAIRAVLESDEFKNSLPKSPEPPKFVERPAADGRGRFKPVGESIGVASRGFGDIQQLFVSADPATWLRVMPSNSPGREWSVDELASAMQSPYVQPLSVGWGGYSHLRTHEGFGIYGVLAGERGQTRAIVFAFASGEVWSIDTYLLEAYRDDKDRPTVPSDEKPFRVVLAAYANFLVKLGITPPFRWIAGMENLRGRLLYVPAPPGRMRFPGPHSQCGEDVISESGIYSPGDPEGPALKPFFEKLYNACGVRREE